MKEREFNLWLGEGEERVGSYEIKWPSRGQ